TPPVDEGAVAVLKAAVLNDDDTSGDVNAGDTITYTYTVTNTDTVLNALNVTVTEPNDATNPFTGTGTVPVPANETLIAGGSGNSTDATANDSSWDLLAPGDSVTFTATYTLTQADVDAGKVDNSAVASGTDPFGNALTDTSDDNTNGDGSTVDGEDDPT
ncbi:DUF7507 domain-containing protein, partial [Sagittula sp. SSi028]|uniref:DUF7507 domain-containing protein n=1 Tax=Sagittula sp. SSi028 TaxID=3400636 RepID=UPI003AF80D81